MGAYFLDSSAVVKRFSKEAGTSWVLGLFRRSSTNSIYISRITTVETIAGLAKQLRTGTLTTAEIDRAEKRLIRGLDFRFHVAEVNRQITDLAVRLVRRHHLRGYDAIQLATAIKISGERTILGGPNLVLVSADKQLNTAAIAEGFFVDDPNAH